MKKIQIFLGLCLLFSLFVACENLEGLNPNSDLVGTYQQTDLMIVNSENGIPQRLTQVTSLGSSLELNQQGTFTLKDSQGNELEVGTWKFESARLLLGIPHQKSFQLEILSQEEGILELSQDCTSLGKFADATVYYSFHKE